MKCISMCWFVVISGLLAGCAPQAEQPNSVENSPVEETSPPIEPVLTVAPPVESPVTPVDDWQPESGFTLLSLADFESFQGGDKTWSEESGLIFCSGIPKSYLYTRELYTDFTWRAEFRFVPRAAPQPDDQAKSNTGFMIHIQEPHKVWPSSLEVQGRMDEICSIKANGGAAMLVIHDDPDARSTARKPLGEWNQVEIVSRAGAITSYLNEHKICESEPGELARGLLGLQSEMYPVEFRKLRIRRD